MSLDIIIETGTYVGNGATQSIAIGWQPDFVLIASTQTAGNPKFALKFEAMATGDMMTIGTAAELIVDAGIVLVADGFDLETSDQVNKNTVVYHYMVIRAGHWFDAGAYTGNGTASQAIITGRQPDAVFVSQREALDTDIVFWKWSSVPGADYGFFTTGFDLDVATGGLTLTATGFDVSDPLKTNEDDKRYAWIAMYPLVGSTRHAESGSYIGSAGSGQSIVIGVQPKFVVLMSDAGGSDICGFKFDSMAGADYSKLTAAQMWDTSGQGITLTATGFDVGTDFDAVGETYYWLAGYY